VKKVLVTGAGGFIGSHLVEACVDRGYDVRAFVRYNSSSNWGWLESSPVKNDIEVIAGDIRDYDSVEAATEGVDAVFHLAALIGIPYSYVSPMAYIKTNIEGTYNIVQSARRFDVSQVLVTSTSETYGTAQYVPIDEKHPAVGQSPYAASKVGADQLALSYHLSFDLPVKIVRPFNTYGPRQSSRAIIPTVMSQLLSGITKLSVGNTTPTRDLTFVQDTAQGFLSIADSDACLGRATNIGNGDEISIGDLIKKIAEICQAECEISVDSKRIRPSKSEVERLYCDNTQLCKFTDWKPSYTLTGGLQQTTEWIRGNLGQFKPDRYTV
jgi:NAD dependent epimerase/dehydratase